MTRSRLGSVVLPFALLLTAGSLAACGNDTDPEPSSESSAPTETTPSTSPTPSQEPTASPTTPDGPLLSAAELPGLNEEWAWQEVGTEPTGPDPIGMCAKFDVLSIGATEGQSRTYVEKGVPDSDSVASMHVIEFPDEKTAQRASAVLDSWRDGCAGKVSEPMDVQVDAGRASWYLVTSSSPTNEDDGHFHAFGTVVNGPRIALLTMDNDGQDRNYEAGQDPMELAVALAADRIR